MGGFFKSLKESLKSMFKTPKLNFVRIIFENYTDAEIRVVIKGSMFETIEKSSPLRRPIILYPETYKVITLIKEEFDEWIRYIFVEVSCLTPPSKGKLDIYVFKEETEEKIPLVKSLEVRDTETHTPKTDPDKIFVQPFQQL